MVFEILAQRFKNVAARRGWAIPPVVLVVGGIVWDLWLLSGHASTATWLYSLRLHFPHLSIGPWGPPFWLGVAGLVWLGILAFWPFRQRIAPIIGTAELLAVRLDMNDLHIDKNWAFSADFGAFVRMSVAVTDKPRTIKGFAIEVRTLKDGTVQEPAAYGAVSERNVGDHLYRYKQEKPGQFGYVIQEEEREEMPDLMSKLEVPLQPDTGQDGWARFEMKGVKHELAECHIVIFALDVRGERHEIDTTKMIVKRVEDGAYVVPKRRNW